MSTIVKEKVAIPEQLTIGGVTYVVKDTPEIQAFIADIAKVEKTKLYSQIESVKKEVEALNQVTIAPAAPTGEFAPLSEEAVVSKVLRELGPKMQESIREAVSPLLQAQVANQRQALDEYRQSLITANEGTCIPDLVKGDTKEELEASLKESIRLRAAYPPSNPSGGSKTVDPLLAKQFAEAAVSGQTAPTASTTPAIPATPATPESQAVAAPERQNVPTIPAVPAEQAVAPDIKSMSPEEFARQRERLKSQIETLG